MACVYCRVWEPSSHSGMSASQSCLLRGWRRQTGATTRPSSSLSSPRMLCRSHSSLSSRVSNPAPTLSICRCSSLPPLGWKTLITSSGWSLVSVSSSFSTSSAPSSASGESGIEAVTISWPRLLTKTSRQETSQHSQSLAVNPHLLRFSLTPDLGTPCRSQSLWVS